MLKLRKSKAEKGITLIALIITIVVLLILAVVAITAIRNDGILSKAENAANKFNEAQNNEEIMLALNEWNIVKYAQPGTAFEAFMKGKFGESNVQPGITEEEVIVTLKDGNKYKVKTDGTSKIDHSEREVPIIAKEGVYAESSNIKEVREGNIPIPNGFDYVKGDHIGGAVITDGTSEFVWVPVNQINDMVMCQTHGASVTLDTTTLQCPTCGSNTKLAGKLYDTGTGNFNANLTGQIYNAVREPDVITSSSGSSHDAVADNLNRAGFDTSDMKNDLVESDGTEGEVNEYDFKQQLTNEFSSMAASVNKYHGFYVGRYEMSLNAQSKANEPSATGAADSANTWYGLYAKAKTYTNASNSVKSSMIWGSQYDAMMRWLSGNNIVVTQLKPIDLSIGETARNKNRKTGSEPKDKLSNIYDLLGNSYEWTLEAKDTYRVFRGGQCFGRRFS